MNGTYRYTPPFNFDASQEIWEQFNLDGVRAPQTDIYDTYPHVGPGALRVEPGDVALELQPSIGDPWSFEPSSSDSDSSSIWSSLFTSAGLLVGGPITDVSYSALSHDAEYNPDYELYPKVYHLCTGVWELIHVTITKLMPSDSPLIAQNEGASGETVPDPLAQTDSPSLHPPTANEHVLFQTTESTRSNDNSTSPEPGQASGKTCNVRRSRNTLAARRYRQRRLDRIAELEQMVSAAHAEKSQWELKAVRLQGEATMWKSLYQNKASGV